MFIIWGSKKQRERLGMISMKCPACQASRPFTLYETLSKFTLYYLPIFSYNRKQVAVCSSCGYITEIPKGMESKIRGKVRKEIQTPEERARERQALSRTLRSDPNNELAWLSMAALVDLDSQKRECFEKVLAINPDNRQAKYSLARLNAGESQPSFNPPKKTENNELKEGGWRKFLGVLLLISIYLASMYFSYGIGFTKGKNDTAQRDSTNARTWRSEKWHYEITFPADWEPIERDNDMGADIICRSSNEWFSTIVYASKSIESRTLAQMEDEILQTFAEYEDEDGKISDISSNDYVENGITYRRLIFRQADNTFYASLVIHNSYEYIVFSAARTDYFESARKDFDVIAASLNFFD